MHFSDSHTHGKSYLWELYVQGKILKVDADFDFGINRHFKVLFSSIKANSWNFYDNSKIETISYNKT